MTAWGKDNDQLLKIVIEQLKLPLINIARQAELASELPESNYRNIRSAADIAIRLIDGYLLSISENEVLLNFEPVSLYSVMNSAAENLYPVAEVYNCEVKLNCTGCFAPVLSERRRLEAALTMLGFSFIEAQTANRESNEVGQVLLTAYNSPKGVSAGIFSPQIDITNESFSNAMRKTYNTRQTMPSVSQSPGAGIMIADALIKNLSTKLQVAKHNKLSGLSITLLPSKQLELII